MDAHELKKVLQKLEIFFERDVSTLILHLKTMIAHNQPPAEIKEYARKLLKGLQVAQRLEAREQNEEIRGGRKDLASIQARQLADIQVMIRSTELIFAGKTGGEKELEDEERDLLYSLREELQRIS